MDFTRLAKVLFYVKNVLKLNQNSSFLFMKILRCLLADHTSNWCCQCTIFSINHQSITVVKAAVILYTYTTGSIALGHLFNGPLTIIKRYTVDKNLHAWNPF